VAERTHRNEASPPEIVRERFSFSERRTDISNFELEPWVIGEKARREKSILECAGFEQ
jgi:hypothetical protein